MGFLVYIKDIVLCVIGLPLYFIAGVLEILFTSYVWLLEGINRRGRFYTRDIEYSYIIKAFNLLVAPVWLTKQLLMIKKGSKE